MFVAPDGQHVEGLAIWQLGGLPGVMAFLQAHQHRLLVVVVVVVAAKARP